MNHLVAILVRMAEARDAMGQAVVCPHCKKTFTPELIERGAKRYRGFKCPHCRLFVASDRAVLEAAKRPGVG